MALPIPRELDLSYKFLDLLSVVKHADLSPGASHVLLAGNRLGPDGIATVLELCNRRITILDVAGCELGGSGLIELANRLKQFPLLQSLSIRQNQSTSEGITRICNEMAKHPSLGCIDFSYTNFDDSAAVSLNNFIVSSPVLTSLNMRYTTFPKEFYPVIFASLKHAIRLRTLDLSCIFSISAAAFSALSVSLESIPIEKLILGSTNMNTEALRIMQPVLSKSRSLTSLSLESNRFDKEEDRHLLLAILKTNQCLQHLDLFGCYLGPKGGISIAFGLFSNRSLTSLNLRANDLQDEGMIAISHALERNENLLHLNLEHNHATINSSRSFLSSLKINRRLRHLNLKSNDFPDEHLYQFKILSQEIPKKIEIETDQPSPALEFPHKS